MDALRRKCFQARGEVGHELATGMAARHGLYNMNPPARKTWVRDLPIAYTLDEHHQWR